LNVAYFPHVSRACHTTMADEFKNTRMILSLHGVN
jgi:hypothetical protein